MILLALVLGGFLVAAGVYCWREEFHIQAAIRQATPMRE